MDYASSTADFVNVFSTAWVLGLAVIFLLAFLGGRK